ncbi:MAG: SpoIIIAH-like family protein [Oscillospiraceae bacterium]|nr:SpoIIIAH-like family protein [Oscillospiraceae bacterium]
MKLNMLIGKRQLILAGLVVVLGVAVYLNWEFSKNDLNLGTSGAESSKTYGETQLTDVKITETSEAYFAQARLNRQKNRDEALESVQTMLQDTKLTDAQKSEISAKAAQIAELSQCETAIEELVKAKGFQECVAFVDGETASVVVSSDGLSDEQAAQIFDIVLGKTKINSENINIVEAK